MYYVKLYFSRLQSGAVRRNSYRYLLLITSPKIIVDPHNKWNWKRPKVLYKNYKSTSINEVLGSIGGHGRWYNTQKSTKHRHNKSITSFQTERKEEKEKGKRKKEEINIKRHEETG